ncbi:hypothetical protein O181_068119 [Austropuccinia psidii MF-1]|uniref:Uncharacterized protein n=1 Tax=Austropuccinia psidii MF-1 TaxID=1389203 RepID=A0A9Q3EWA5_9BASI|nr:hypothetical protein [Austropuccinia psidii MF-1]
MQDLRSQEFGAKVSQSPAHSTQLVPISCGRNATKPLAFANALSHLKLGKMNISLVNFCKTINAEQEGREPENALLPSLITLLKALHQEGIAPVSITSTDLDAVVLDSHPFCKNVRKILSKRPR